MKSFSLILFSLFFSLSIYAQSEKTTYEISDRLRDSRYSYLVDATSIGKYIYTIRNTGNITKREYTIQQFDRAFNLLHEKQYQGIETIPTDFVVIQDNVYLVERKEDRKKKIQTWSMRKINSQTFRKEGDIIRLTKQDRARLRGNLLNSGARGFLLPQFTYSPDSSKVMMYFEFASRRAQENKRFEAIVIDENAEVTFKKQVELPYRNREFEFQGFYVSNEGDVYVIGGKDNFKGLSQKTREMVLHQINQEGKVKTKKFELNKARDEFTGISLYDESNKNLRLVGFVETRGVLSGLHFFELDQDLKLVQQKYHTVDSKEFISTEIQDQIKGSRRSQRRYEYTGHLAGEDNSVILTAERRHIYTRNDNAGGITGVNNIVTVFNYTDVFICKVENDLSIDWMRIIPKRQRWEDNDQYISFSSKLVDNTLHVVYLDDVKNLKPGIKNLRTLSAADRRKMVLVDAKVDVDSGKLDRDIIFSPFQEDAYPLPAYAMNASENELIFFAKRGKNDRIINVTFW